MREMRLKMLSITPKDAGLKPTPEFPFVSGIVMDWPLKTTTVTVVSHLTGDASVYTTGTFGVIGGIGHEAVRTAATNCVKLSQKLHEDAIPTTDYPYPTKGRVRFYLICYDGVRVIDADLNAVEKRKDKCSDLFMAVQKVLTELRLIAKSRMGDNH